MARTLPDARWMDLEILEALAVGEDRSGALAQLLPGSQDHDYYRCLHAQHAGRLDEAAAILEEWGARHGHGAAYERLRVRQMLLRVHEDPDAMRDHLGVQHWHEAEVAEIDPTRPTRLAVPATLRPPTSRLAEPSHRQPGSGATSASRPSVASALRSRSISGDISRPMSKRRASTTLMRLMLRMPGR